MSIKDGGPAFPSARDMRHNPDFDHEGGMTIRDHFAGLAMQGMIACGEEYDNAELGRFAYDVADAMIRAREAGQ